MDKLLLPYQYSELMEHSKWTKEIPYISFPPDWKVKIIPPFGGAVIRFLIEKNGIIVSVYLDCYDNLGCHGAPYWEVYPYDGDIYRCDMEDTKSLISAITYTLNKDRIDQESIIETINYCFE
jgi:hypothetical protein